MLEKEAAEARKASSDGEVEKPDSDKPAKKAKKPVAKAKGKMMSFDNKRPLASITFWLMSIRIPTKFNMT